MSWQCVMWPQGLIVLRLCLDVAVEFSFRAAQAQKLHLCWYLLLFHRVFTLLFHSIFAWQVVVVVAASILTVGSRVVPHVVLIR